MATATSLLILLIAASAFSTLIADVSLDCGSSDTYYSDDYSIGWIGDDNYIQHGESLVVQSSNSVYEPMRTLRAFTDRKKSCYAFTTDKGSKTLVRASFYYGNYDKKSSPPTFDLHLDGNHWTTVETSTDQIVYYEIIYVTKTNEISVCVAQTTPNMFPFISAIEVRDLDSKMYAHFDSNYALMLKRRVAYGTTQIIRSTDDIYDRIWVPAVNAGNFTVLTTDNQFIDVTTSEDNPPEAVLENAFAASSTSNFIRMATNLPADQVPIYMNMYFSEVSELDSTEKRSFELYIDGARSSLGPFSPAYLKAGEMVLTNFTASSNTSFTLVATSDSTLPPLINALEVFTISDKLTDGTHSDDVSGLAALTDAFSALGDWVGDPCLPSPYSWDWINCTSASTPRVTALNLGSFDLSGFLPDFSSMTSLEIIDLHNNSISGSIPEFLGTLPNLKQLNLADNGFSGTIPSSISKNTKLKLVVSGNPDLCVSGKSCNTASSDGGSTTTGFSSGKKKKKNNVPVILGTVIPIFVLIWVVGGVCAVLNHKRKSAAIAAGGQGGGGGVNRPNGNGNGTPPQPQPQTQAGKLQMQLQKAANEMAQNLVNDFRVNIQDDNNNNSAQDNQPADQNNINDQRI